VYTLVVFNCSGMGLSLLYGVINANLRVHHFERCYGEFIRPTVCPTATR